MDLNGRTALVTGANRGIGRQLVDALLAAGAGEVIAGARDPKTLEGMDARVRPLKLDVTDPAAVTAASAAVEKLDVLINNAGVLRNASYLGVDELTAAREEMDVNYWGTVYMCRAFAPQLRVAGRAGGAAILNVMSTLARVTYPFCGSYCASKHAVYALTHSLRAELSADNVHVIEAYPGLTDTDMVAELEHLPKSNPADVAAAFVAAIISGSDEVYVGDDAEAVRTALSEELKALQREAYAFAPPE
ncbi:MAG: SDR family NAD(P)-dependent oxidoreductase [Gammaproteobacteria bacterium]|nr:SDR family NAD(P)-dependent oxidoreductase [Gammaproteobacteria bacterium]